MSLRSSQGIHTATQLTVIQSLCYVPLSLILHL